MNAAKPNGSAADLAAEQEFGALRQRMVSEQLVRRGIRDLRVLDAMSAVPRHAFVPPEFAHLAYADQPLPIGNDQTISQPYMVAAMAEALDLGGDERVLEIGAGSGYQAAVLARLAAEVITVETHAALAEDARQRLAALGIRNVRVIIGDGTLGWPESAPYGAMLVTAAAPRVPQPLLDQLAEGGRLVIPVGGEQHQDLLQLRKAGVKIVRRELMACRFVPLVGRHGWH